MPCCQLLIFVVSALRSPLACLIVVCLMSPSILLAQTIPSSTQRTGAQPWRPTFSPINNQGPANKPITTPQSKPVSNPASQPVTDSPRAPASSSGPTDAAASRVAPTTQRNGAAAPNNRLAPLNRMARSGGLTRVTKTFDKLPNEAGQVWREYDITPYTSRIDNSDEPQKAVLEWILRETGAEMWFSEPMGLLHVGKDRLFVYHTPEIQDVVKSIVDRFVWTRGQMQEIDINLVTVENPNWRSQTYSMLQPIEVKSPGVEAWMISKENASILLAQLRKRADFREHGAGRLKNHDGQVQTLEKTNPVQFVRNLRWVPNQIPNYQPLMTQLNEGYRLSISVLSSINSESIEAIIKCDVDQVENLTSVKVALPGIAGTAEQMNLQIPQIVSWRLHERFRWPNDQVLLLSCGVVATPEPQRQRPTLNFPGMNRPVRGKRADALLFVDYRGPAQEAAVPLVTRQPNHSGRLIR